MNYWWAGTISAVGNDISMEAEGGYSDRVAEVIVVLLGTISWNYYRMQTRVDPGK